MEDTKYITIAIHTYDYAVALKKILEAHNINVRLENLVLTGSLIPSGVRVKIDEKNLPLALKLTESGEIVAPAKIDGKLAGKKREVLIPIDYTPESLLALHMGFDLARRLSLRPVILHAFATPYFEGSLAYGDSFDGADQPLLSEEATDAMVSGDMRKENERLLASFKKKVVKMQEDGKLPMMDFDTSLSEGIPEEVILEYCRLTPPMLVVMATRGKEKKDRQLVGSVTAEVMDSCRVPMFAIPENCRLTAIEEIRNLVFFCNLDQHDIVSVDTLMRMFDYPEAEVTVVPVNDRAGDSIKEKVDLLCDYFNKNYPTAHFSSKTFSPKNFREEFDLFVHQEGIEMLIVPNKKKNIFSRLFNPGIAHRMLFERDMPLLALPV